MNKLNHEPPRTASDLLCRLVPGPYGEDFCAELRTDYKSRFGASGRGLMRARLWYWSQVLSLNTWRLRRGVIEQQKRTAPSTTANSPRWLHFDSITQDIRDALRTVRKSPAYATTVVVTFALAVGANVAVFSVVNGVLLRPLPYLDPGQLVMIKRISTNWGVAHGASLPDIRDWRREAQTLSGLTAYQPARETYFGTTPAEEWFGVDTTPDLFVTLGVQPLLGRTLQPGVDPPLGGTSIVLSHRLWQHRFNGDSTVIGRTIRFEHRTVTVVGVMPPQFYFPTPAEQYWMTLGDESWFENRGSWGLYPIGRLASGVSLKEAQLELSAIAAGIDAGPDALPEADGVYLETRHQSYVGDTKTLFTILVGAVVVVLAIACANIANMGLTRAAARRREFAIRAAVGAGWARLVRQLMAESIALALMGAAIGVGVAHVVVRGLLSMAPANLPRQHEIGVDPAALVFATVVAVLCGIVFGLAPALSASRFAANDGLQDRSRAGGARHHRTLKLLVISQIALSQVLVVSAGLLLNSFWRLSNVRPGFDTEHTLTMQVHLPSDGYEESERVMAFHRQLTERVNSLPGVVGMGLTSGFPFGWGRRRLYYLEDEAPGVGYDVSLEVVTDNYLETMGIPMRMGRRLATAGVGEPPVALINQRMADLHWAKVDPLGRQFRIAGSNQQVTIVGVVGTVLNRGLVNDPVATVYLSLPQTVGQFDTGRRMHLAVRSASTPEALAVSVRGQITALDPRVVVTRIRSTASLVSDSVAEPRFRTILIGSFAALALLVALVGVYSTMGFVVAQRRREIGVRMALGADSSNILSSTLRGGVGLIAMGLAIGTVGAAAASRVLSGLLFGITAVDPATFSGVTVLLATVAIGACYLPAKRASGVDPISALRE